MSSQGEVDLFQSMYFIHSSLIKSQSGFLAMGGPIFFCNFVASPGFSKPPFPMRGNSPRVSFALFCSIYSCAFALSGNAGRVVGRIPPFCTRSSAIGKAVTLCGVCLLDIDVERTLREGAAPAGAAGSAAARARKMQWVFRDLSAALGLALRASAYRTP